MTRVASAGVPCGLVDERASGGEVVIILNLIRSRSDRTYECSVRLGCPKELCRMHPSTLQSSQSRQRFQIFKVPQIRATNQSDALPKHRYRLHKLATIAGYPTGQQEPLSDAVAVADLPE